MIAGLGRSARGTDMGLDALRRRVYAFAFDEYVPGSDVVSRAAITRSIGSGWGERDFDEYVGFMPKRRRVPYRTREFVSVGLM
jgi:hypothetical protein